MSFTVATETAKTYYPSLNIFEIFWISVLSMFLIAPLIHFLISKCRNRRDTNNAGYSSRHNSEASFRSYFLGGLTKQEIEARREYLDGNLKTHKVIMAASDDTASSDNSNGEESPETKAPSADISKIHKGDLILSPPQKGESSSDLNDDDDDDDRPMCAICVTSYEAGDEICWSKNHKCHHCFHKDCIQEWLLQNEDCPCCRLRFLGSQNNKGKQRKGYGSMQAVGEDNNDTEGQRNLRLTAEDEDAFGSRFAEFALRNSFHSSQSSGRDDDGDFLDTSGRTEEVTDQDDDDQHTLQLSTEDTEQADSGCGDIELGMPERRSPDDVAKEDSDAHPEAHSDAHLEEQMQHC